MAHNFFGIKFGIRTPSRSNVRANVTKPNKRLMNIPTADDILDFRYPPESQFHSQSSEVVFEEG